MQFRNHVPASEKSRTRGLSHGGTQWKFVFDNGYGASVINDGYGSESGLYELAVLGPSGDLTYDTPITSDVLGFLNESEVADALDKIAALSASDVVDEIRRRADRERDLRIDALRAELAELEAEVTA